MAKTDEANALFPEIRSIDDKEIADLQINVPIDIYIQYAKELYQWSIPDKGLLVEAGLKWELAETVNPRAEALREAESIWQTQKFSKQEYAKLWKEISARIFESRKLLLHHFRFAYRNNVYILNRVNDIAGSQSYASMIQDLNDLCVLGKSNQAELNAVAFKMALLDEAKKLSYEGSEVLATAKAEGDCSEAKKFRDKAFVYLKKAVDEICQYGQYIFWKNDARRKGYINSYLRRIRNRKENTTTVEQPQA